VKALRAPARSGPPGAASVRHEDKVGRRAIRVCDLAHLDALDAQLDRLCAHHDALRAGFGRSRSIARRCSLICADAPFVLQFAQPVWKRLQTVRKAGARILFEGAQGVLLDVDHGTIRSSRRRTPCRGRQLRVRAWGRRRPASCSDRQGLYHARGSGPFPTELSDEVGQRLGERGHEFGTVTGRKRRCGWFDAVLTRQSCAISGSPGLR
jgi:adenylosuccinate synthase